MNAKKYVVLKDIVIPAGTVLSSAPTEVKRSSSHYDAVIGFGADYIADFVLDEEALLAHPEQFATIK